MSETEHTERVDADVEAVLIRVGFIDYVGSEPVWCVRVDDAIAALAPLLAARVRAAKAEALAPIEALAAKWERHARLFVAPADQRTREDWEHVVRSLRAVVRAASYADQPAEGGGDRG